MDIKPDSSTGRSTRLPTLITVLAMVFAPMLVWLVTEARAAAATPVVAFVERIYPANAPLSTVVRIRRDGRDVALSGIGADLVGGDEVYLKRPGVAITVRMLTTSRQVTVQWKEGQSGKGKPDFTLARSGPGGLYGESLALIKAALMGPDQGASRSVIAGSRGNEDDEACANAGGETNSPATFRIPALTTDVSYLAPGSRPLFVSWRGGAAPFSIALMNSESGALLASAAGIQGCSSRLASVDLKPGRYQLSINDANGVSLQEENLVVASVAPELPRALATASLTGDARTLYLATWLAAQDEGRWRFEAVQRVASLDCRAPGARDWLAGWGGAPVCAS